MMRNLKNHVLLKANQEQMDRLDQQEKLIKKLINDVEKLKRQN